MTDNEIIKALKCCEYTDELCCMCPEIKDGECIQRLHTMALDLINRQASENERLALELDISKALHKEAVAERNFYCHQMIRFESMFKTAKSEAIKEFVERLKEIIYTHMDRVDVDGIVLLTRIDNSIDKIAKEMTEVKENEKQ